MRHEGGAGVKYRTMQSWISINTTYHEQQYVSHFRTKVSHSNSSTILQYSKDNGVDLDITAAERILMLIMCLITIMYRKLKSFWLTSQRNWYSLCYAKSTRRKPEINSSE